MRMRNRKLRNIRPSGNFWPEITSSPIGLPLEVGGCFLGRLRPISSMVTGTNPFTGYLLILFSYNIFLTKVCCFQICCVVFQGCSRWIFCYIFRDFDVSWFLPLIFVFIQLSLFCWFVPVLSYMMLMCHNVFRFVFVCSVFWVEFQRYGRKVSWIVKWYGKYGRKVSWNVKWYGKYGIKVSWKVKWYEKYGRKPSWIVKRFGKYRRKLWKDINNMEEK